MPTHILRPNADQKADWTEVPSGAAWSTLDDAVTQPTAGNTTDRVDSTNNGGQICRVDVTTFTLASNEVVESMTLWTYGVTGNPGPNYTLSFAGITGGFEATDGSYAWQSYTVTGPQSQANIDGLGPQVITTGSSGATCSVATLYVSVLTKLTGAAGVSGSGSIAATGRKNGAGAVAGAGTISATGLRTGIGAGAVSGAGTIAATGQKNGAAAVSGAGSVAAAGRKNGAAAVSGAGTISATGSVSSSDLTGAASVSGSGSIAATGIRIGVGAAGISGAGTISATGLGSHVGAAAISGAGTVAATGARVGVGAAAVSGVGTIAATGLGSHFAAAAIAGVGTISATAELSGVVFTFAHLETQFPAGTSLDLYQGIEEGGFNNPVLETHAAADGLTISDLTPGEQYHIAGDVTFTYRQRGKVKSKTERRRRSFVA